MKSAPTQISTLAAAAFVMVVLLAGQALASGFGIFTQGASGLGQANAVVAHTTGPSSVFFNPALINELPGTQVEIGTTAVFPNREFQSDTTGRRDETVDDVYFPSTLYLTHRITDDLSLGAGFNNTFGLGTEWPKDWEGRYLATRSTITTLNFNPVVSYRLTPAIALAAGVNVLYLDAELSNKINSTGVAAAVGLGALGSLPDAEQEFTGDDFGYGYNLGLLIKITDNLSLGAGYRSEIELDLENGKAKFKDVPAALAGLGIFTNTKADTSVTLPAQAVVGLAVQATDNLTLEAGSRWEQWSSFDDVVIKLDQPVLGQSETVTPRDWDDTYAFTLGGRYRLNDTFSLLAGYLYGDNPIPSSTFEPAIPDSDTHLFTLGSEIELERLQIAFSYGYQRQEDRDKNNNLGAALGGSANGSYENEIHLLALSLTCRY
ncbi:long-chain fatty acid transporter [Desulfuromonas versatilis]|uniref:Long-chain fatty acid transporter n=1 Tax=Desulfuromonas versatilis TaxID=2802975 RepID=A0ABN6DWF7_9BACT|nr:outer membrane protein transport protein [Desulfuromonas versatilis]BCR04375.1 long-chain fatty acid transporter [Desulfuromonas versatilis]